MKYKQTWKNSINSKNMPKVEYKPKAYQENFTNKLKLKVKENGLTQKQLYESLNLSQSTVSAWYCGKSVPKYDTLKKLSEILNVPMDFWDIEINQADEQPYYIDPETRELAEKMKTDKNLKLLFSVAATAKPEDLKTTYIMLKALKDKEENSDN